MPLDANEQYLLELINRARLDPVAEMARYNAAVASGAYSGTTLTDLNSGLAPGTISNGAAQPLAGNENLNTASIGHSLHMLAVDLFEHSGIGDGDIGSRATGAGYAYTFLGENISWSGTTGAVDLLSSIENHQFSLFRSNGHRSNLHNATFTEIGLGREIGQFASGGTNFNASMLTEMFGDRGAQYYLTGVVYNDTNANRFYTPGEGLSAAISIALGGATASAASGGYSIIATNGTKQVTLGSAVVTVTFAGQNIKLDLVNGNHVQSSTDITAVSGVGTLELLGIGNLFAHGNSTAETLIGNAGNNGLFGNNGNDTLNGGAGNDALVGGIGDDRAQGGAGNDVLLMDDYANPAATVGADIGFGDAGDDLLWGYGGNDELHGGADNDSIVGNDYGSNVGGFDLLFGEAGNDTLFVGLGGNAYMDGGSGNDTFFGGASSETQRGGTGNDYLYGAGGADTFQFYRTDLAAGNSDIVYFMDAGDRLKFGADLNGALVFQDLPSLEYSPGLFTTGVYITAFLGGGATSTITVYGSTVATLMPMVDYTL